MLSSVSCQTPLRQRRTGNRVTGSSAAAATGPGPAVAVMSSPGRENAQSSSVLGQPPQQRQQLVELRRREQVMRKGLGLLRLLAQHLRLVCAGCGQVQSITATVLVAATA